MDANILCQLIAKRIPPDQFQFWGTEIHWMAESYDTPENRAIVDDVIANYETLASEYEESQKVIRKRQAYKLEADPLYIEWQILLAVNHPDAATRHQEWLDKRSEIDLRFIKET
jgi:hypothetical protein